MDVKEEDKSEESKKNHLTYYKSLTKLISDFQEEKNQVTDPTIKNHLDERIDAVERDRKRIREMFPDITNEEWDVNTNWKKSQQTPRLTSRLQVTFDNIHSRIRKDGQTIRICKKMERNDCQRKKRRDSSNWQNSKKPS